MPERRKVNGLLAPTAPTLAKYGMSEDDFFYLAGSQNYNCPICGRALAEGRYNIDHVHVRGWKAMLAAERRSYVRGILCWFDNRHTLGRVQDSGRLRRAADYMDARRPWQ